MDISKFEFYHNPHYWKEKYVLKEWDNKHLTLRVWNKEKEFDLHITDQTLPKKHKDKHKTILPRFQHWDT
jgi:hypothetical protein